MLTLTGYFILSVQVMLMFPIIVNELAGTPAAVKWMYAIEAALSLTLLYPLARWSEKHFRLETRLMAGLFLMSLSMFPVALTHSLHVLFAIICLFYLGSVIAEPARNAQRVTGGSARTRQLHGLQPSGAGIRRCHRLYRRRLAV